MTKEEQVHQYLSKPFKSENSLLEFSFYFRFANSGLIEIIRLKNNKVDFLPFDIIYNGDEPIMNLQDLEIMLTSGESLDGFTKPLKEAIYFLTHEVSELLSISQEV